MVEGKASAIRRRRWLTPFGAVLTAGLLCAPAFADDAPTMTQLGQLSLEELANLQVTSVSRRPEPLSGAAAAIYVITADDIRRSGATSLPEALRLAPNLEVARINAFSYAITARGFNSPESGNKLLVLIDGRSIYSPLASTVFWQGMGVPVANIERIEVISGPGGTLYGANAVNGVINVITRASKDMQGLTVDAGAGSADRSGTVRYGGLLGDFGTYSAYMSGFNRSDTDRVSPADKTKDGFNGLQGGFRMDGSAGSETYGVQGDIYGNRVTDAFEKTWGGNILARWGHQFDDGNTLGVTAYWSKDDRDAPFLRDRLETYDLQVQDTLSMGDSHQIVWGGEYRLWNEGLFSADAFFFARPRGSVSVGNVFVQDEIAVMDNLKLTLGVKAEDNSLSGFDILPNARIAWQASPDILFWGAISRAVRTPSRIDRELQATGILIPAPQFESEKVTAYELGYRGQILPDLTLSVNGFYNQYRDLRSDQFTPTVILPIQLQNHLNATTYGVEIWGDYTISDWWRLRAGYNSLHKDLRLDAGANDFSFFQSAGQDPPYQAQLRSEMNIGSDWELDATVREVAHVERPGLGTSVILVPSYFEADLRIGWHILNSLEISLDGYNLLHNHHVEVNDTSSYPERAIQRSVFVNIRTTL
jgi:iron complex outermembrane receptor protein